MMRREIAGGAGIEWLIGTIGFVTAALVVFNAPLVMAVYVFYLIHGGGTER
ncbi:MAG: hypothetical protein AABZ06_15125 [Bdellovibrionota bacterium]